MTNRMPGATTSIVACLCVLAACNKQEEASSSLPAYAIDQSRISVSGVSAGAYMAGQFHVAHSALVSGAGLLAGGPYWCAEGSIQKGLGPCMNGGDLGLKGLVEQARAFAAAGTIDAVDNLAGDRVWVFHAENDSIIHPDVVANGGEFYANFVPVDPIDGVFDVAAPHGMPTIVDGVSCEEVVTPFLNLCDYDAAGELLASVAGVASPRTEPEGKLMPIPQVGGDSAEMLDDALLYVPPDCASGETCGLHIAFHGCQQSTAFVGDAFAKNAGYNHWADNARLLVLYPQVDSSKLAPMNPLGCWDWWGYTGDAYATRDGAQIAVVKAMIDQLSGR